ncbi:short chain dehydrogenase [Halioglobus japonicus]|uniref:Short chain dehydrogenase n=1 Tax=Halioglobus japonicus TaxID=930805 RepID=A0AAP8MG65_9GAMM|nr:SDR family oxidoreductase [Halioglobus japonicus]AQA19653.1 short chain dehydrogenase [Halioglobus japonicus]PLW87278.1 short chain dehydrogenase [Halioglobus japonicus]GHD09247.1 short chain dehydrogenase [Halioglobus japonicus]
MAYFITGGTGFIGKFFIEKLIEREGDIYVLTRAGSREKFEELQQRFGAGGDRLIPVEGDLREPLLGLDDATLADLTGSIKHFCHLAAIYDLSASAESQIKTNIEGTRNAIQLAEALDAGCFQHVSSIAAGGMYRGTFREDMFEEAEKLEHPYFATKHDSEGLVRSECKIPWRIYRPAMVVGHSKTGEIDKIDGAYYFFKSLQKLRNVLPPWFPLIGIEGGKFNVVPVDYVVDAMDHIAHMDDMDGRCFHLTDPEHHSMGNMLNIFADAGHTPRFNMRLDTRMFGFVPRVVRDTVANLPPIKRIINTILADMGLPDSVTMFTNFPTRYDNRDTERALKGTGIQCPELRDYAPVVWDYWERNLDPDLFIDHSLEGNVGGKIVLITGASSGIGKNSAIRLAEAGAHVLLVARTADKLEETAEEIARFGGLASIYQADVSVLEDCDRLAAEVLAAHGHVDILINNAGRSIRRSLELSYDRFHDFERTMQVNYFGAIRLTMALLPSMSERKSGHIINMSSIAALTPSPRFSAYVASKSALDAWTKAAAVEYSDLNVRFTTINMPLVRTPMIEATTVYDSMPVLTPDEATDMVVDAVINKPKRIATNLGIFLQVQNALAPRVSEVVMNIVFRMFNDSAAARGDKKAEKVEASNEQVALAALMKGVHF